MPSILQQFLLVLLPLAFAVELYPYNPVADQSAVVISGNARFTIFSSRLVRMEYSQSGTFEDRATVAVVNRYLTPPNFSQNVSQGVLSITTSDLQLRYTVGQAFAPTTLTVSGAGFSTWTYGTTNSQTRNLLGTIRSLDNLGAPPLNCTLNKDLDVHHESLHCEWGLISRDGWALINDTGAPTTGSDGWWSGPNTDLVDLYFFGYGMDYKAALNDYVNMIGGKIAMVPRYMSGIMWSIWYDLNDYDCKKIANDYQTRDLPLDVFILDMNWHTKQGWTGYTFDDYVFPYPTTHLDWMHKHGIANAANLHDDYGVANFEKMYSAMAAAIGFDTSKGETIPFSVSNQTIANALEDVVLKDVENQGMDFWWIDWQQGGQEGGVSGGKQNPTIWLNHIRGTDHLRRGESQRAAVLGRFGGLGNHRYQLGFSGDVLGLDWRNMAYQPYFSLTASNVGYGFWSHDLVGPAQDHELHTRWLQWISLSGAFRTHDRGLSAGKCADSEHGCDIVKVWMVPDKYFEANRAAMQEREMLIPYIYTAHREAFDTGLSLIRPMYYDWPQFEQAYLADPQGAYAQYMFGDDLLVSPIVTPSKDNSMSEKSIWLPPGVWIEKVTGVLYNGDSNGKTIITKDFDLSEIPVFARGGSIIPTIPLGTSTLGVASRPFAHLNFDVYPGSTSGSTQVYADDGKTTEYLTGLWGLTKVSYTRSSTQISLTISNSGSYTGAPTQMSYSVRLVNSLPAIEVVVNGVAVAYSMFGGSNTWSYEGNQVSLTTEFGPFPTTTPVTVVITTAAINDTQLSGVKGGIMHAILAKANLDEVRAEPGSSTGDGEIPQTSILASLGNKLYYQATDIASFQASLNSFPQLYQNAVKEMSEVQLLDKARVTYSQALLANALN